jgi:hypothetical protein
MGKLGAEARERLAAAQREELAALRREVECDPHEALVATGGLPRSGQSGALLDAIAARAAA